MTRPWRSALVASGLILMSQAFPLASPVRDAATGLALPGFFIKFPLTYLIFAPFCGAAARLSILSYHQAVVFLIYLVIALMGFLGWRRGSVATLVFIAFLAWVILVPHPTGRLVAADPTILLIDYHSHSSVSHDGRKSFTAESNMIWHATQGYNAAFITDHNRVENAEKAKAISRTLWQPTGYRSLEGEETSLFRTHLVILGNHERIDNRPYDSDPKKIPGFIADMRKRHIPVIASIPEYWWYHWDGSPLGTVDDFIRWGIAGFEIVNSAPKALDFPPAYRRHIVDLCRAHNLPMTGISDSHGWGSSTAVWNAMALPGWQGMGPDALESAVIARLHSGGFAANQVVERDRYDPETHAQLFVAPFADAFIFWRSLQPFEAVSWAVWICLFSFLYSVVYG